MFDEIALKLASDRARILKSGGKIWNDAEIVSMKNLAKQTFTSKIGVDTAEKGSRSDYATKALFESALTSATKVSLDHSQTKSTVLPHLAAQLAQATADSGNARANLRSQPSRSSQGYVVSNSTIYSVTI